MPDNFIKGESLRKPILAVQPDLKGHIDRFGSAPSGEVRYMIDTYLPYRSVDELYVYDRCASDHRCGSRRGGWRSGRPRCPPYRLNEAALLS